jgi:hypothetical protein
MENRPSPESVTLPAPGPVMVRSLVILGKLDAIIMVPLTPESNTILLIVDEAFAELIADLKDPVLPSSRLFVTTASCANELIGKPAANIRRIPILTSLVKLIPHSIFEIILVLFLCLFITLKSKLRLPTVVPFYKSKWLKGKNSYKFGRMSQLYL